jgi:hypothetical protein
VETGGGEIRGEMMYSIQFDFDCVDDPPAVHIVDSTGKAVIEVFEEPTCKGDWSWEPDNWEAGELAKRVVRLLNEEGK